MKKIWTKMESDGTGVRHVFQPDDYAESPRKYSEALGTFYGYPHRHLKFGDEQVPESDFWDRRKELMEIPCVGHWEVRCYQHGGIALSLREAVSDPFDKWDSCVVGLIIVTEEDIKRYGITRDKVEAQLRVDLKDYTAWLNGEVWCAVKFDGKACTKCQHVEWEEDPVRSGPCYDSLGECEDLLAYAGIPKDEDEAKAAGWTLKEE